MDLKDALAAIIEKDELDKEAQRKEEAKKADEDRLNGNTGTEDKEEKKEDKNNDTSALLSLLDKQSKAIEALNSRIEEITNKKIEDEKSKTEDNASQGQLTRADLTAMLDERDRRNMLSAMSDKERETIKAFGFDPETMPLESLVKFRSNYDAANKEVNYKLGKEDSKASGNNGRPLSVRAQLDKYYKWAGKK